jgi:uncharacterized protein (TIGR03067 family)
MPAPMLETSRILIDGDRFRSETPGVTYEGVFNIDVESDPHAIDIEFVEGPEAGNTNHGIFRANGDRLTICLNMNGDARPTAFRTSQGSGCALETLRRSSNARPDAVTGGTVRKQPVAPAANENDFAHVDSATLSRLQGEWTATNVIRDGRALTAFMCASGRRVAVRNEVKVSFGGQTMIHALVRVNETTDPVEIDYYNLLGPTKGTTQLGIMRWDGEEACFCMAAAGQPRPTDFTCPAGSGQTLSQWRR